MSRNLTLALSAFVGVLTIVSAIAFELIGGHAPCKLCLLQRIPYYVGLPLLVIAIFMRRAVAIPITLAAVLFIFGAVLGGYQAGAEWGVWPGPSDCAPNRALPDDIGAWLETLSGQAVISCTEPSLRIFGLSLAGWNALISTAIVSLSIRSLCQKP